MEIQEISNILKTYSFHSKAAVCNELSQQFVHPYQTQLKNTQDESFLAPTELETFALFCVLVDEEENKLHVGDKGRPIYEDIITSIRTNDVPTAPLFQSEIPHEHDSDIRVMAMALNQFPMQHNHFIKFYRYNYFFQYQSETLDMPGLFQKKFGSSYEDVKTFGFVYAFLMNLLSIGKVNKEPLIFLLEQYKHVTELLTIEREAFKSVQQKFINDTEQYVYGFKFFYQYPFIHHDGKGYILLPHLVTESTTTSMYFRFTEGENNKLRDLCGKELVEDYICHVSEQSKYFHQVVREYKYTKSNATADVMILQSDSAILIESKSMSPRLNVRNFNLNDIEHTVDRTVEMVMQLYMHAKNRFQHDYFPFGEDVHIKQDNIYGIVLTIEDSHVSREQVMPKVAKKLNIDVESEEYNYICSNIHFMGLYNYELAILNSVDILANLKQRKANQQEWYHYDATMFSGAFTGKIEDSVNALQTFNVEMRGKVTTVLQNYSTHLNQS